MASKVEICNNALVKVGADRITSIEDETKQAKTLRTVYDLKRDSELSAHPWTFAIARAAIPASAVTPAFGWQSAFPLPAGYLSMVQVGQFYAMYEPDDYGPRFELEAGAILCDEASPLQIRYVQRITNDGLFPPLFAEALACRLAVEVSYSLRQSAGVKEQLERDYAMAIRQARRQNVIEQPPQRIPGSSWWHEFRP